MDELRYACFISYSRKDSGYARRLHRALEHYVLPKGLGPLDIAGSQKPSRLYPVFRDREELPAGDLGRGIESALEASAALIVVLSPNALASAWVTKEIEYFIALGRRDRIFVVVADTVPASWNFDGVESMPTPLRAIEPVAADARRTADGAHHSLLKLLAGIVQVGPSSLFDRDAARKRSLGVLGFSAALSLVVGILFALGAQRAATTRAELSMYAEQLIATDRRSEALPFALAGLPAKGALFGGAHRRASEVLRASTGGVPIVADLGPVRPFDLPLDFYFSADGSNLLVEHPIDGEYSEASIWSFQASPPRSWNAGRMSRFGWFALGQNRTMLTFERWGQSAELGETRYSSLTLQDLAGQRSSVLSDAVFAVPSPNAIWLAVTDRENNRWLRDLRRPDAAPRRLPPRTFTFSPDDRFIIAEPASGPEQTFLIDTSGEDLLVHSLGRIQRAAFLPGSRGFVVLSGGAEPQLSIYRFDGAEWRSNALGPAADFQLAPGGRILASSDASIHENDGNIRLWDLGVQDLRVVDAGLGQKPVFSPDNRHIAFGARNGDGDIFEVKIVDIEAPPGASPVSIGQSSFGWGFSGDGAYFATLRGHASPTTVWLHRVDEPEASPVSLGPASRISFSAQGRFAVLRSGPERAPTARLVDLSRLDADAIDLGGALNASFSPDGRYLVRMAGTRENANGWVHDLNAISQRDGRLLREDVCAAGNQAVRPYSDLRRSGNFGAHLAGRPWNPCDWRGVLAILPRASTGDGWFEGLRQWLRLVSIQLGNAKDWACEETTSQADAELVAARRRECALAPSTG